MLSNKLFEPQICEQGNKIKTITFGAQKCRFLFYFRTFLLIFLIHPGAISKLLENEAFLGFSFKALFKDQCYPRKGKEIAPERYRKLLS